ncbi:MAG: glycogen/starch synthase [Treponema sp.]|nr:glycogen/starch synthase [Treponema sp.]
MRIWMVAREYAGVAEAGGVKNVVCSLSEALARLGHDVVCFVPFYGCVNPQSLGTFRQNELSAAVESAGERYLISYSPGFLNGVKIILVGAQCFWAKQNVYTYCAADREIFPDCKIGEGYADQHLMNTVFEKAILAYGEEYCSKKDSPQIVHCHDACAAALPAIVSACKKNSFEKTKFVVTIHNAGPYYHHEFKDVDEAAFYTGISREVLEKAKNGERVEPYLLASLYGLLTTVSPDYAKELSDPSNPNTDGLSKIFAQKKIPIVGVTNGFDLPRYEPMDMQVSRLPYEYNPEKLDLNGKYQTRGYFLKNIAGRESPEIQGLPRSGYLDGEGRVFFAYHGRLVRQKGILVLLEAARKFLKLVPEARLIINGQGEEELKEMCAAFANENRGRVVFYYGYEKAMSRMFTAAADFALLPSDFEPCGTEDFIAQAFGTIPVAHATGGLKKIINGKTGFLYEPDSAEKLCSVMVELAQKKLKNAKCFDKVIREAAKSLRQKYTWKSVAKEEYERLYWELMFGKKL